MQFFIYMINLFADLVHLSMIWKCGVIIVSLITLIPCVKLFSRGK